MHLSRRLALLLALPAVALESQQRDSVLSPAAIAKRATSATVTILTFNARGDTIGLGSGAIIRPTGEILTNYHVLAGATRAIVRLSSGERFDQVWVVEADEHADVAIIKVPAVRLPVVSISSVLPAVGSRVVVIGSPLGLSSTVSDGIISALRQRGGRVLIQISAPISPGSSGGPVFSELGDVFGIATSYLEAGQQLNFATPVKYALALLQERHIPRALGDVFASGTGTSTSLSSRPRASEPVVPAPRARGASPIAEFIESNAPRATTRPRLPFGGTFLLVDTIAILPSAGRPGQLLVHLGLAWILQNGSGVRISQLLMAEDSLSDDTYWRAMTDLNAVPDGRLSLSGISFDPRASSGVQTENGACFSAGWMQDDLRLKSRTWIYRYGTALGENVGLYDITLRSDAGSSWSAETPWRGELLIAPVHNGDSTYLNLFVRDPQGRNTGLVTLTPTATGTGTFVASSRGGGSTLTLFVRNGRVAGDYVVPTATGGRLRLQLSGQRK